MIEINIHLARSIFVSAKRSSKMNNSLSLSSWEVSPKFIDRFRLIDGVDCNPTSVKDAILQLIASPSDKTWQTLFIALVGFLPNCPCEVLGRQLEIFMLEEMCPSMSRAIKKLTGKSVPLPNHLRTCESESEQEQDENESRISNGLLPSHIIDLTHYINEVRDSRLSYDELMDIFTTVLSKYRMGIDSMTRQEYQRGIEGALDYYFSLEMNSEEATEEYSLGDDMDELMNVVFACFGCDLRRPRRRGEWCDGMWESEIIADDMYSSTPCMQLTEVINVILEYNLTQFLKKENEVEENEEEKPEDDNETPPSKKPKLAVAVA